MRKLNLELPKYRLQLHLKLIKRRKPLVEPIVPTPKLVNKKYRAGTFLGRLARYLADHKSAKKVFASGFSVIAMMVTFYPQTSNFQAQAAGDVILEAQTNLTTIKGLQYPVAKVKINQNYGFSHPGVDFGGKVGDAITPITAGVVTYAGWNKTGYGNLVVITHKNGLDSYYAHLSKINVITGSVVDTTNLIGEMGVTGRTTGPHLHLEIHQKGASVNPLTILSK